MKSGILELAYNSHNDNGIYIISCIRMFLILSLLANCSFTIVRAGGNEEFSFKYAYGVYIVENYTDQTLDIRLTTTKLYSGYPQHVVCDIIENDCQIYLTPKQGASAGRPPLHLLTVPISGVCNIAPPSDTFSINFIANYDTAAVDVIIYKDSISFSQRDEDNLAARVHTTSIKRLPQNMFWLVMMGREEPNRSLPEYMNSLIEEFSKINAEFVTVDSGDYGFYKITTDLYGFNHVYLHHMNRAVLFFKYTGPSESVTNKFQHIKDTERRRKKGHPVILKFEP